MIIFTCVKCMEFPVDPKSLFPETGPLDGVFRSMYANEYRDFINRTIPFSIIPPFSTSSLSNCSISCLRYYCNGFVYNSDTSDCRLIHHRYYNLNVTEVEVGSKYFMTSYDSCPTDQGYVYFAPENFCVKLNTTKVVYSMTHYYCVLERGSIVRVDSFKKLSMLQNMLENQGYNNPDDFAFIMSRPTSSGTTFEFEDQIEFPYYDWMTGKPEGNGDHIVIGGNNQQMADVNETDEHGFICEKFIQKHIVG